MITSVGPRRRQAMNEITLRRTGDCPVRFRGKLLATASGAGQRDGKKPHLRWYEITLYQTERGAYAVHVGYRTRMDGEVGMGHDFVEFVADLRQAQYVLRCYNPIRVVVGHVTSVERNFRADKLEQALRRSYDEVVSDLFDLVGLVDSPDDPGPFPYAVEDRDGKLLGLDGAWHPETFALGHRNRLLRFRTAAEAQAAAHAVRILDRDRESADSCRVTTLP